MLLFDWGKIFKASQASALECIRIVKMLTYREVPKNRYDPIYRYSQIDFSGNSFLVHPDYLIYNSYKHKPHDIGIYLAIASVRSLAEYKVSGDTTVDPMVCPEDPFEYIDDTRLLYIGNDNRIHFLYEEVPQEKNQWH